ncbi:pyridoxamine 5'-phosphate oxidase family protein [Rhodoblastus sp.]|uniref:pyridoxamine 5'-phosphate oxidase family protein n=1 Tax=Rhodoblastus sp. TaxID=1962975 RepID=UPI0035AF6BBE
MSAPLLDRRPWHEGEIQARHLAGAPAIASVIRTFITDQQRDFFARLPMVFVAGLDATGAPAASILRGAPGFATSPEPRRMEIAARFPDGERMTREAGAPVGLIGMDFSARRRNRVNGRIISANDSALALAVDEAFGNCPKYIAPHALFAASDNPGGWIDLPALDSDARALIERAETFFIATRGPDGLDMSHRGGPPGFVAIDPSGALLIPDFPGNNYFNTFGNLLRDPRAALLFIDFPAGRALHLAGRARVALSEQQRFWVFVPETARRLIATPFGT